MGSSRHLKPIILALTSLMVSNPPELSEKDFIQKTSDSQKWRLWALLGVVFAIGMLFWGAGTYRLEVLKKQQVGKPFLQVSNRDFSLFLWQNPEYMRVNAALKNDYLIGFRVEDKIRVEPLLANEAIIAPPEVLFRYHVWKRLVQTMAVPRKIGVSEFKDFLAYCEEWQPRCWQEAPVEYRTLIEELDSGGGEGGVLEERLPSEVCFAFQGWKNYFVEGEQINQQKLTCGRLEAFLKIYPTFARSYWKNVLVETCPDYLKTFQEGILSSEDNLPSHELAAFLRVALFNQREKQ